MNYIQYIQCTIIKNLANVLNEINMTWPILKSNFRLLAHKWNVKCGWFAPWPRNNYKHGNKLAKSLRISVCLSVRLSVRLSMAWKAMKILGNCLFLVIKCLHMNFNCLLLPAYNSLEPNGTFQNICLFSWHMEKTRVKCVCIFLCISPACAFQLPQWKMPAATNLNFPFKFTPISSKNEKTKQREKRRCLLVLFCQRYS